MSRGVKAILVFGAIFILFIISLWLLAPIFHFYIIKKVFNYVVQNFINVTGMSPWLAKGSVIFLLIPFIWAILEATRIKPKIISILVSSKKTKSRKTSRISITIIVCYIGVFFLSMFFLSRDTYFGHMKGEVMKYYAVTPEGIRFFDSSGFDPKYGIELKPVTPKMIEQYERAKRGMRPKRIDTAKEIEFFDSITGTSKVWYFKDSEGNYEFYDQPGFHPVEWEELKSVTREIILDYKNGLKYIEGERIKKLKEGEEKRRLKEKERRRQEKLVIKRTYIESHINPVISNDPSRVEIAVLIAEKKTMDLSQSSRITGDKIGEKLTKENTKAVSNLFRNAFIKGGNFKVLYQGDIQDIFELEIKNHVDYLILGTKKATFSTDSRLGDLVSCSLHLDLKIYSAKSGEIISSNSLKEAGVGIDEEKAEQQAIDRIIRKAENFIFSKIKN